MDLVEKMIIKKGSINLSDLQMIKFQIEMDKPSIDYHNKSLKGCYAKFYADF